MKFIPAFALPKKSPENGGEMKEEMKSRHTQILQKTPQYSRIEGRRRKRGFARYGTRLGAGNSSLGHLENVEMAVRLGVLRGCVFHFPIEETIHQDRSRPQRSQDHICTAPGQINACKYVVYDFYAEP